MNLNNYDIENGVYILTPYSKDFEYNYIQLREKEFRILTDSQVGQLPFLSVDNPNHKEWKIRQKTCNRFSNYLQNKNTNLSILDIGCGNGWFSNKMAKILNTEVLGVDINKLELEQARHVFKNNNLKFALCDIFQENTIFNNAFDIITLNASVQYFSDLKLLMQKLISFLKPNGEIHIMDSPFYQKDEIENARQRTIAYYTKLGFPKMSEYYFHHSVEDIHNFTVLNPPKKLFFKRFVRYRSPFLSYVFKNPTKNTINKGFSKIANKYEEFDKNFNIATWGRKKVRIHLEKELELNSSILEINCGSGIDAVYLAKKGYKVHATDIAEGMLAHVRQKITANKLQHKLTCEKLSFNNLNAISDKFNHIFSNFGGLNCSSLLELKAIFNSFNNVLAPNGKVTLVIMPKICIWEFLSFLKGNPHAFRRLKKNGVLANIEGEQVATFYHSKNQIKNLLLDDFTNFKVENICFIAPTGNRIDYPNQYPKWFKILTFLDTISNKISFLQGYGDYYILSATKK